MTYFLNENWKDLTMDLPIIKNKFYNELIQFYSSKDRFYHNIKHIETLLRFVEEYRCLLKSPKILAFTIWYHDAIYDVSKSNNEEESAKLAKSHLLELGVNKELIECCHNLIIATKTHQLSRKLNSFNAQFLLDIDLYILAVERKEYVEYTKQIRKEYQIYNDSTYKKGRMKVINHFLEMKHIYKTELFQNLWEEKAKENLSYELAAFCD